MNRESETACSRAVRNTLVVTCAALALLLGLVAIWALEQRWPERAEPAVAQRGGAGGEGQGTGTGMSGTGTGAGLKGDGPGADPDGTAEELQGTPDGTTTATLAQASGTDSAEPVRRAAPSFGFTSPEAPQVPQPPIAPVPADPIGTGNGPAREGAAGAARPGAPEFLGIVAEGRNVVYVLDFSGSMNGPKIMYLKIELKRSIFGLTPKNTFQVILFHSEPIEYGSRRMLPATKANTRACANWIDEQHVAGGTDPAQALEIALSRLKPDTIYLLTDGVFDDDASVFRVLAEHNPEGKVQINTIGFGQGANEATLRRIASANRGAYTFIDVPGP